MGGFVAEVEQETIRAIVEAYAEGKIDFEKKPTTNEGHTHHTLHLGVLGLFSSAVADHRYRSFQVPCQMRRRSMRPRD